MIPALEHHCGSWIAVNRDTGAAVLETFSAAIAGKVNQSAYAVFSAAAWLGAINAAIRAGRTIPARRRWPVWKARGMAKPLSQSERIARSPGGFHRRAAMRRNHPATRRAFDQWLEATRASREGEAMP